MSKRVSAVVGLLLVAALLAACGGGSQQPSSPNPGPSGSPSSSSSSQSVQRIEVSGIEFAYNPSTITVKRGQTVEIVFKNDGTVPHDFVIDQLNVKSAPIAAGQTTTLRFTPNQAGQFKIYCAEPGHEAAGMVATLVVE